MDRLSHPFPPLYDADSRILILGSFPSVKSREAMFFYGHPQNRFWRVVSTVLGCECPRTVEEKQQMLHTHHIALWDTIASCKISGSSDSSIKNAVKGYREINIRGLRLVKDGGYFATCSCSHFMTPELFTKAIQEAARSAHRRLRQIEYRTQAADHPILWAGDETSYYLKFYIFQVVDEK